MEGWRVGDGRMVVVAGGRGEHAGPRRALALLPPSHPMATPATPPSAYAMLRLLVATTTNTTPTA